MTYVKIQSIKHCDEIMDIINETAKTALKNNQNDNQKKQLIIWVLALVIGAFAGCLGISKLNTIFNFLASVYTRLFQFIAIPTIALAVITTLSKLGTKKSTGQIFAHAAFYTLLTTFCAALIGLLLYVLFAPDNISVSTIGQKTSEIPAQNLTYCEYLLSIIPNNILQPLISGNVLSVILIAATVGLGLSFVPETENKAVLVKTVYGLQELLFTLIHALIWALPLGIMAFSAQLLAQITSGNTVSVLGKYVIIVLGGNIIQMFVIIPIFLLVKKLNPIDIFRKMSPALVVAFFTKSSAGTLPVTLAAAEKNLKINPSVSRFVLPICTTINMNGCAAFILITSLFVMQNSGIELTLGTMILWLFIAVFAAIGNAGVPMGCYFLTLSLMSSIGANLGLLGVILPVYAIIDMIETVENVWSDSAVCAMTNRDLEEKLEESKKVKKTKTMA